METKNCPQCKETIDANAKKCKHCGSDLRNWFARHKIMTTIVVLLLFFIAVGSIGVESSTNTDDTTQSEGDVVNSPVDKKVSRENCNLVQSGMSRDEVTSILGEPSSTSESAVDGLGELEYLHFQDGFSTKACSVTLNNDKVSSRTWTDL